YVETHLANLKRISPDLPHEVRLRMFGLSGERTNLSEAKDRGSEQKRQAAHLILSPCSIFCSRLLSACWNSRSAARTPGSCKRSLSARNAADSGVSRTVERMSRISSVRSF